jgi:DNA-3-methyladenine glycosylase II
VERRRFTLEPPRPYSLALTARRFARFPEVVNRFEDGVYRRLIVVERSPLLVSARQEGSPARAVLRVEVEGTRARAAASRRAAGDLLERTLGVATDVRPFYRAFRDDPLLGPPIRAFRGLRTSGFGSLFESLVTAVFAQQVNLGFAYDIRREICLAYGRRARVDGETRVAFPTPARLARESEATLRRFRLSRSKAATLLRLARAFRSGVLEEGALVALPDEEVVRRLTELRGIGAWTAETALMRGLGRLDAFPAGDLGVTKYVARGLLGHAEAAAEADMRAFSERWRPYRSLALTYAYAELARRSAQAETGAGARPRRSVRSGSPPRRAAPPRDGSGGSGARS